MSPKVRILQRKALRYTVIAAYDLASLLFALFVASFLHAPGGLGYFAALLRTDPIFFPAVALCWLLLGAGLRLFLISLSSFGVLDALRLSTAAAALLVFAVGYASFHPQTPVDWRVAVLFVGVFFLIAGAGRAHKRLLRLARQAILVRKTHGERAIIVGAGSAGTLLLHEIRNSRQLPLHVVLFVDDKDSLQKTYVEGVRVAGKTADIPALVEKHAIDKIIIAIPSAKHSDVKRIYDICVSTRCPVQILPGIYQLVKGQVSVTALREVDVADLLGRGESRPDLEAVMAYIEDKTVLVTGGGGSIGSELCRQIAAHAPRRLIILDIYENNAYEIEQELLRHYPELSLTTLIASVRDAAAVERIFAEHRPDIVFHAAAHKHVPLMETSPAEAVKNNVFGTKNVVAAADRYGVLRFVLISTDKAVNPTNIMGATKRICEMLVQTAARHSKTEFVAVRFGNVLGSNGSVIPLFRRQIAEGGPVTLTHRDIIRYFMTIPEAVSLVLQAGAFAKGGEIFVLDMGEPVRIYDLACNLIRLSGYEPGVDIEIRITGLRPGEKLYEERLMAEEGLERTANEQISIGRPIPIDEEQLKDVLVRLQAAAEGGGDIRKIVSELVPTYEYEKK